MIKKNMKANNKGFTLVELVIVVAILAILVGLLAPQYTRYVEKSRKSADAANMDELIKAFKIFTIDGTHAIAENYDLTIASGVGKGTMAGVTGINSSSGGIDAEKELKEALDKACPNWAKLTTKSKKWGTDGKPASIKAHIEITSDGGISVSYEPPKFAEYMGKAENNTKS